MLSVAQARTKRGNGALPARSSAGSGLLWPLLLSFKSVESARHGAAHLGTGENFAVVSERKIFGMNSQYSHSCGSGGFSKLSVKIKNCNNVTVFDTFNTSVTSFESRSKL